MRVWFVLMLISMLLLGGIEQARASPQADKSAYHGGIPPPTPCGPASQVSAHRAFYLTAINVSFAFEVLPRLATQHGNAAVPIPGESVVPTKPTARARSGTGVAAFAKKAGDQFSSYSAEVRNSENSAKPEVCDLGDR